MMQNFRDILNLDTQKKWLIALTGGGGKTSLIFRLAEEFVSENRNVIVSTTTHMAWDPRQPFAPANDPEKIADQIHRYGYAVAGYELLDIQKLGPCSAQELSSMRKLCDVLLVEADGAKRKPLKVPRDYEPAIPEQTDLVIGVIGLDCLGKKICDTAHRPREVAAFLEKSVFDTVTVQDLVKIAASGNALKKGIGKAEYLVCFHKSDVVTDRALLSELLKQTGKAGIRAFCGSVRKGEIMV